MSHLVKSKIERVHLMEEMFHDFRFTSLGWCFARLQPSCPCLLCFCWVYFGFLNSVYWGSRDFWAGLLFCYSPLVPVYCVFLCWVSLGLFWFSKLCLLGEQRLLGRCIVLLQPSCPCSAPLIRHCVSLLDSIQPPEKIQTLKHNMHYSNEN